MELNVTVKNYRCFSEKKPLEFRIRKGAIALVGPNNSGKSALLKLIHELKPLWHQLSLGNSLETYLSGVEQEVKFKDIEDPVEIFCNSSKRNVSIELKITGYQPPKSKAPYIEYLEIEVYRDRPSICRVKGVADNGDKSPFDSAKINRNGSLTFKNSGTLYDCNGFMDFMKILSRSIYVGPHRNAINEGASSHYGLNIGTEFIGQWNEWKNGKIKDKQLAIQSVTEDIAKMLGYQQGELEINASSNKKTLNFVIKGKPYRLQEIGSGMSQIVFIFANIAIKKPSIILIDEPELNLHPTLQMHFLNALSSYSTDGVIFATHSIGLARSYADNIYSFQIIKNGSEEYAFVREFEQTYNYTEFIGELSYSSYSDLGFKKILLVEGPTDVKTIQQFLRKLGVDHKIVIMPLGGDSMINGNREQELGELNRIAKGDIYVLIDSERSAAAEALSKPRKEFMEVCSNLKFRAHATERRATENYFTADAVKSALGTKYEALGPYDKLKEAKLSWGKENNWRIAKEMKIDNWETTDVGVFLKELAKAVDAQ